MLGRPQLYGAELNVHGSNTDLLHCWQRPNFSHPVLEMIERDIGCWHLEPDSELYMAHVSFGSASRLSMTHIIASLAKPSAMRAKAS